MTPSEYDRFTELLADTAAGYLIKLTPEQIAAYWRQLLSFDLSAVEAALAAAPRMHPTFFPKIGELVALIEGSAQDRAAVAWRTFCGLCAHSGYPSLQITDGAFAYAIEEMGGYREAVAKIHDASPEMERAYQKTFEQFYKIGQARGAQPKYVLGEFEARNRGLQSWTAMRDGKPVQAFEVETPVFLVGTDRFVELKMPLDLRTGQLAAPAREALTVGGDALRAYLPAPPVRQIGAGAIPAEERATPEEIAEIHDAVAALAGGRRLTRRQIGPAIDESGAGPMTQGEADLIREMVDRNRQAMGLPPTESEAIQ